ncbi:MAG: site-specific integrase [Candidatus Nitrosopolaris sp.]
MERCEVKELESVRGFLDSKAVRSKVTAKNYLTGLVHFNNFLSLQTRYTVETILEPLRTQNENVYQILSRFVISETSLSSSPGTIKLNLEAVKSYLGFHDIYIIPQKFDRQVTLPKLPKEEETPLDASDIRNILQACNNRRLKSYLLVLASGGMRAVEGLAIRIKDINFSINPTKIHIQAKFSKTRVGRDIYISDEASKELQKWIYWRYRDGRTKTGDDLVFHLWNLNEKSNPATLYFHVAEEFAKLLDIAGFSERKEASKRHKVTLKSFRSFVHSTISDAAGKDFAEYFIGHAKSPYWLRKEDVKREIYHTKCMKHLTFLDFTILEARGRSIEANLLEKDQEIQTMKEQTQILSNQLADVIEQQQQHADTFDMKFVKLLEIVKTSVVQDDAAKSLMREEIVKMMPRKLTTKELQKIEALRNLTGVFIDSTVSKGS